MMHVAEEMEIDAKLASIDQKTIDGAAFSNIQLALIKVMDDRYKVFAEFYKKYYDKMNGDERSNFGNWFFKILDIYSIFVNKYITNDDFLLFRIDEYTKTEPIELIGKLRRSRFS